VLAWFRRGKEVQAERSRAHGSQQRNQAETERSRARGNPHRDKAAAERSRARWSPQVHQAFAERSHARRRAHQTTAVCSRVLQGQSLPRPSKARRLRTVELKMRPTAAALTAAKRPLPSIAAAKAKRRRGGKFKWPKRTRQALGQATQASSSASRLEVLPPGAGSRDPGVVPPWRR
jgi:hypothetical protein